MNKKLLLLGLLRQQEMHGYELNEFINSTLSSCTDMKKSTAYYLLKKMEDDGLLSQEIIQQGSRPPRQVYQITEAGEEEFQRLLRKNLSHYNQTYLADDIGIAFLDTLDTDEAINLLEKRRREMQNVLDNSTSSKPRKGSLRLVFEHFIYHLKSELAWTEKILKQLKESKNKS